MINRIAAGMSDERDAATVHALLDALRVIASESTLDHSGVQLTPDLRSLAEAAIRAAERMPAQ